MINIYAYRNAIPCKGIRLRRKLFVLALMTVFFLFLFKFPVIKNANNTNNQTIIENKKSVLAIYWTVLFIGV
jgi:hypothetical protein